jgi:hypothetical protein
MACQHLMEQGKWMPACVYPRVCVVCVWQVIVSMAHAWEVEGLGLGLGFRVRFRVSVFGLSLGFRVQGSWFRV